MTRDELLKVYQAELPRLRSLVGRHLGYGSPEVEDILQDVFVQAWLHCDALREDRCCAGWLTRIAAHDCITYLRRSRRCVPCEELPAVETEDGCARMMAWLTAKEAIAPLSASARRIVWLHDLEGYPLREIAQRMNKPENTIKSVLYRARAQMRRLQMVG